MSPAALCEFSLMPASQSSWEEGVRGGGEGEKGEIRPSGPRVRMGGGWRTAVDGVRGRC